MCGGGKRRRKIQQDRRFRIGFCSVHLELCFMRIIQKAVWDAPSATDFACQRVRVQWSDGSVSTIKVPQVIEEIRDYVEHRYGQGRTVAAWTLLS